MCAIYDVEFGSFWIPSYDALILCALFVFVGLGTGFDFHQSVNLMILSSVEIMYAFHLNEKIHYLSTPLVEAVFQSIC